MYVLNPVSLCFVFSLCGGLVILRGELLPVLQHATSPRRGQADVQVIRGNPRDHQDRQAGGLRAESQVVTQWVYFSRVESQWVYFSGVESQVVTQWVYFSRAESQVVTDWVSFSVYEKVI